MLPWFVPIAPRFLRICRLEIWKDLWKFDGGQNFEDNKRRTSESSKRVCRSLKRYAMLWDMMLVVFYWCLSAPAQICIAWFFFFEAYMFFMSQEFIRTFLDILRTIQCEKGYKEARNIPGMLRFGMYFMEKQQLRCQNFHITCKHVCYVLLNLTPYMHTNNNCPIQYWCAEQESIIFFLICCVVFLENNIALIVCFICITYLNTRTYVHMKHMQINTNYASKTLF